MFVRGGLRVMRLLHRDLQHLLHFATKDYLYSLVKINTALFRRKLSPSPQHIIYGTCYYITNTRVFINEIKTFYSKIKLHPGLYRIIIINSVGIKASYSLITTVVLSHM
jgi:hypothetical protein